MSKKSIETPYPTFLELIRLVARALDLKNSNKKLDDKARSKDVNPFELKEIIEEVIHQPLRKYFCDSLANNSVLALADFNKKYHDLVASVSVDGLRRQEVYPYLVQGYFSMWLQYAVVDICEEFDGPSPLSILDENSSSVTEVLTSLENTEENWPIALKSMSKENRDRIASWRRGLDLPSSQSIHLLRQWCDSSLELNWDRIYTLLLVGRALDYIKRNDGGFNTLKYATRALLIGKPEVAFDSLVVKHQEKLTDLYQPVLMDVAYFNSAALIGDIEIDSKKLREAIDHYRSWLAGQNRDDVHGYFADRIEARWYLYSGDLEKSKECYQRAFENGVYRVGSELKNIINEAFVVTSCQRNPDKVFLKRLKWAAVLFGYDWPTAISDKVTSRFEDSVEEWEIEAGRKGFTRTFKYDMFFDCNARDKLEGLFDNPFIEYIKEFNPDYRNPNRKIKLGSVTQRVMPQLVYFSMEEKLEVVEKLINQGADVNIPSEVGDTAIMLSLRCLNPFVPTASMDRSLFDLLASKPHKPETLNLRTQKKRLMALSEAVESGKPDIVKKLLDMGADPNQRSGTDLQTPLHSALKTLAFIRDPEAFWKECEKHEMSPINLDGLRRHLPAIISNTQETEAYAKRLNSDPSLFAIKKCVQAETTEKVLRHLSAGKLREIAKILIDAGADPNAEHNFPLPGYTPMMLAAENDEVDIFEYMFEHGGQPKKTYFYKPDNRSYDCFAIALTWSSKDVFEFLKAVDEDQ